MRATHLALATALVLAAACAGVADEGDRPSATTGAIETMLVPELPVADVTTMDLVAPVDVVAGSGGHPTVVVLHGTLGDRSRMLAFAQALARRGVVVFVPTWPVIEHFDYSTRADDGYLAQAEAVVCSLRAARVLAADVGGDPADLTLIGFSGGGMVGAPPSLVTDPPWRDIDCLAGTEHAPNRFIGIDGDYLGYYQYARSMPLEFAAYDPFRVDVTNHPTIRLWAGLNDQNVNAYEAGRFLDRLLSAGLDAALVVSDAKHGEAVDPTTTIGRFVVDQVAAELHGEPDVFDAPPDARLELVFDDERCELTGPTNLAVGDVIDVALENHGALRAAFGIAGLSPTAELADASSLSPGTRIHEMPRWFSNGGYRSVDAGETASWTWVVDDRSRWLPLCYVDDPASDDYAVVVQPTVAGEVVVLTVS